MTYQNTRRGFTLIELLVVVLIIGILATVAVPQYQRAVQKAQFTKLRVLADAIGKTVWPYYLANGYWPSSFEELDVSLPSDMSTITSPVSYATCASNAEMYCCISLPQKNYNSGVVRCAKSDYSLSANYVFTDINGTPQERRTCSELATDLLCRTLPGAVRTEGTAIMTPKGWKSFQSSGGTYSYSN